MIFKFKFVPFIVFVLAFALLVRLGVWQIDRWGEKTELLKQYEININISLSEDGLEQDILESNYKKLSITGVWVPKDMFFLDMRKHKGISGMQVVMPMLLSNGKKVLINRGWVKHTLGNKDNPIIKTPINKQNISGIIRSANKSYFMTNDESSKRKMFVDIEMLTENDNNLFPGIVIQVGGEEDGLIRDWQKPNFRPAMHLGYAIMWFAFAIILLVMSLYMSINREKIEGQ